MKIKLITISKNMPAWVNQGIEEYRKRLPPTLKLEIIEIPLLKRSKNVDIKRCMAVEAMTMQQHIDESDLIIALDRKGLLWDTLEFAKKLKSWYESSQNVAMLIGGPEGLDESCLQQAKIHWSLSDLTYPHPLVRIIIVEQLYRAWSLLARHPYHR